MASPTALITGATWLLGTTLIMGVGLLVIAILRRGFAASAFAIRSSLWIGLLLLAVGVAAWQILWPAGGIHGLGLLALLVIIAMAGWALMVRTCTRPGFEFPHPVRSLSKGWRLLLVLIAGVWVLATLWSLGQPGNYDTGLYHIGAISYARDFGAIPGLAHLHERFGFNSVMWPLSAFFSQGPWEADGFRLVNGVLLTLASVDLFLRLSYGPRSLRSPGTLALATGLMLILGVIAQYPARLIASSAQDTAALILGVVSVAYMLDFFADKNRRFANGWIAAAIALVGAMMRPLGWVFFLMLALVVAINLVLELGWRGSARWVLPTAVAGTLAFAVMAIRDAILSGWILFPLGGFPVSVPWRLGDPSGAARDITGWARTPFQDVNVTLANNDWISGWFQRLPTDWSIPALLTLLCLALFLSSRQRSLRASLGVIVWASIPILVTLVAWLLNAPDPRFAWGVLISLGLIPLSVFLAGARNGYSIRARILPFALSVALVGLIALAGARGSFSGLALVAEPPPVPIVEPKMLLDGTEVLTPTITDQCWNEYPLCRPMYADPMIRLRGAEIGEGFTSATSSR